VKYPDLAYKRVTCRDCKATYICSPGRDYYGDEDEPAHSATEGRCWECVLKGKGINPETIPVLVIYETGRGIDPRDGADERS
jgi:hypothetical protein